MTIESALTDLNNAILDIQQADHNTYERPVKKMALALNDPELQAINKKLKDKVDFEDFIQKSNAGGSMVGSAQLNWPLDRELELGLTLQLIDKAGSDPSWLQNFAFEWYYDGNKIISALRKLTRSVLVPFQRDYTAFIANASPAVEQEREDVDSLAIVDRLKQNRVSILYVSELILRLADEVREEIRGDNKLSFNDRTAALEALGELQNLCREAMNMSEASPDVVIENGEIQSWSERFKSAIGENLRTTFEATNLAHAAVPTGLILGCGALGALIAGPVGFGAGSVFGHLITGQIKPGAAAKEIEKAISQLD